MAKRVKTLVRMNWSLKISYRGTGYHGWQKQSHCHLNSVQEVLETALRETFNDSTLSLHGSGRTDAGVHALSQVASFEVDCHASWTPERLKQVLNHRMPADIAITAVERWPEDLHARFSACGKTYFYVLNLRDDHNPFMDDLYYSYHYPLDVAKIKEACTHLIGTHDFTAYAAKKKLIHKDKLAAKGVVLKERPSYRSPEKPTGNIRTIYDIQVIEQGGFLFIAFSGSGFLYKMVRSLVGHLLWVGNGRCTPDDTKAILAGKVRTKMVETAPARGLYLAKVFYENDLWQSYDFMKDPLFPTGMLNSYPK